jgi:hypothetical protein
MLPKLKRPFFGQLLKRQALTHCRTRALLFFSLQTVEMSPAPNSLTSC